MSELFSKKFNLDKLYTKDHIADFCISKLNLSVYDNSVEPSAGGGAFFKRIPGCIGYDLLPECDGVIQRDWLTVYDDLTNKLVIGNPPFGKRNLMSLQFIKHAMSCNAESIAFILPNAYKKHTLQKHIGYGISEIYELPANSFTYECMDFSIPCSFFIFNRHGPDTKRFNPTLYKDSKFYSFASKKDYDFFVFGAAPKNLVLEVNENNRGYFIKCDKGYDVEFVMSMFRQIDWKGNSSASGGVSWFTKPEIVFHTG